MKRTWSADDLKFITDNYPKHGPVYCAEKLGKSYTQVKSKATVLKLKYRVKITDSQKEYILENHKQTARDISKETGLPYYSIYNFLDRSGISKKDYIPFSEKDVSFLRAYYPKLSNVDLANALARTHWSIKAKAEALGLKRTPEEAKAIQRKCSLASQFKKGSKNHNEKFDGAVTIRNTKGTPYKYIRISKSIWQELHIHNWVKANGAVPEGKILRSVDGDTLNCDPDNWVPVLRSQHLELNSGRQELTDKYIINMLTMQKPELKEDIAQMPELIHLKRNQLKINRVLNENRSK